MQIISSNYKDMIDYQKIYSNLINKKKRSIFLFFIRIILIILSGIYYLIVQLRLFLFKVNILKKRKLSVFVISVGNITLGGTGKTPFVLWLTNILNEKGKKVAILSRGYKGKFRGKIGIVSDGCHILMEAEECGDEPLLLAKNLPKGVPVIVGKNRFLLGEYALNKFGIDIIILDDGFQHLKLFRDLDIVLINSKDSLENECIFPRGILREPLDKIKRADVLIFTKFNEEKKKDIVQKIVKICGEDKLICESIHKPVSLISLKNKEEFALSKIRGKRVLALSGIGDPLSFEDMLRKLGAKKVMPIRYSDHYNYKLRDIEKIMTNFKDSQMDMIITTEKDTLRLENTLLQDVACFYLRIKIEVTFNKEKLIDILNG